MRNPLMFVAGLAALGACTGNHLTPISGHVLDLAGKPIAGATVALADGGEPRKTDAGGAFSFAAEVRGAAVLAFNAPGYARTWVRRPVQGTAPQVVTVQLKPIPPGQRVTLPPVGQSIKVEDKLAAIMIPGGALCDAHHAPVSGDVLVSIVTYDPADPTVYASITTTEKQPGTAELAKRNPGGEVDFLISQDGALLEVCAGQQVTLIDSVPHDRTPGTTTFFLDPTSGGLESRVDSTFDPATGQVTTPSRDLTPHCPDWCGDGYCECPWYDCYGTCQGSAWRDCAGNCYGSSRMGCDGVCSSAPTWYDCSGTCGGSATDQGCGCGVSCNTCPQGRDCAGTCGGSAVVDCNGTCGGGATRGCDGVCGSGKVISGCDNACGSTKVDVGCGCGVTCQPCYVIGTIRDIHGQTTTTQVTAATAAQTIGQQGTSSMGAYSFHLGDIGNTPLSAIVTPAPRPGQRLSPAPAWAPYPIGTTTLNFQYCIDAKANPAASCLKNDLCCDGLKCIDGECM